MIYLKTLDTNTGAEHEELYYCWGDVFRDTFSPDIETVTCLEFKTHGKTYAERRENLRQLAVDFQNSESGNGLYMSDICSICDFFRVNGSRFGLMREFRENGIV